MASDVFLWCFMLDGALSYPTLASCCTRYKAALCGGLNDSPAKVNHKNGMDVSRFLCLLRLLDANMVLYMCKPFPDSCDGPVTSLQNMPSFYMYDILLLFERQGTRKFMLSFDFNYSLSLSDCDLQRTLKFILSFYINYILSLFERHCTLKFMLSLDLNYSLSVADLDLQRTLEFMLSLYIHMFNYSRSLSDLDLPCTLKFMLGFYINYILSLVDRHCTLKFTLSFDLNYSFSAISGGKLHDKFCKMIALPSSENPALGPAAFAARPTNGVPGCNMACCSSVSCPGNRNHAALAAHMQNPLYQRRLQCIYQSVAGNDQKNTRQGKRPT